MNACESYIDLIMRSIDRETTPQEEAQLQSHLEQCAACRALYDTYRALDAGIAATEEEPPENLTRAVMNSIRAEQRERSPKHLLKRFRFTAIAAAAAVIVLVFARFQPSVTSVTSDSANTAISTAETVPQVEAELWAAEDVSEGQAAAVARSGELLEEAVEEPAAEEECMPEEAEMPMEMPMAAAGADTVTAAEDGFEEISLPQVAETLQAMGLYGDVLLVRTDGGQALTDLLPEAKAIVLETGALVYEVPADAVELAVTAGELTVSDCAESDTASGVDYLIVNE